MWILLILSAVLAWSILTVFDSQLVRHFESNVFVVSWTQSAFSVPMLLILALFIPIHTPWALPLFAVGALAYGADLLFWRLLKIADVSTTNFVWAFLSIFLTGIGFVFFHETWSLSQAAGAACILAGVTLYSLWQRESFTLQALLLIVGFALLLTPFYGVQKWALAEGQPAAATFYWAIMGREIAAVVLSPCIPQIRRKIIERIPRQPLAYFLLNWASIALFLVGIYLSTRAFQVGPASLVSVLINVQSFVVIILAWVATKIAPAFAPRELLTARSVQAKIVCFLLVFAGLALLGAVQ